MRVSIKTFLVMLLTVMSFVTVQAVQADDITVTGEIFEADRFLSTIVIEDENGDLVVIQGFPFHNLEVQLNDELDPLEADADGITIEAGDCLTVEYSEKELASGDVVSKWESLAAYCEECTEIEPCFEDEDGLTRKPQRNSRPDPPAGPWNGKPPGFSHRP